MPYIEDMHVVFHDVSHLSLHKVDTVEKIKENAQLD